MKPIVEIDGAAFQTLEEFYEHFGARALTAPYGRNLDAFNDVLRGGFGTPDGGFRLRWLSHRESRERLGYEETVRQLELRLERCHPTNTGQVEEQLRQAKLQQGPTVFDWLVEIIRDHGPGGSESADGIELELA